MNTHQKALFIFLALLFFASISQAEIYKWIDASGQTHYSEKKEDAGQGKAVELKVAAQPVSIQAQQAINPTTKSWQEQERQFKQRQAQQASEKAKAPTAPARPQALSNGRSDETDISRCNLARDVLSGAVRHRNQAPTDKNDREIVQNDIRTYCH
jgi:hypothetical protein